MNYEIKDCIDAGTEYCPCHLAETGDCLLCSHLQGKNFCDCTNWKGVCIYQEYSWNGNHAKKLRKVSLCKILKKEEIAQNVVCYTINAGHKLVQELSHPGSFVFARNPKSNGYFDAPISIMDTDVNENIIKLVIESKGIKTKTIDALQENDNIAIRGPYWNGVLGLKNIYQSKDSTSLLIARGIGMAPMIPVMKKLYSNGNKIIAVIDKSNFKDIFIKEHLDLCDAEVIECNVLEKDGSLSEDIKGIIKKYEKDVNVIYCAGPDIFISNILNETSDTIKIACCNNARMCCGEGICGTCSTRYDGDVVKRLCKLQIDPKFIFKDRRSL